MDRNCVATASGTSQIVVRNQDEDTECAFNAFDGNYETICDKESCGQSKQIYILIKNIEFSKNRISLNSILF